MKKTKIICTLGPATMDDSVLRDMVLSGMNIARLNFSHGTHEDHKKTADRVKSIRQELNTPIGLMLDTMGPKIRIRKFEKGQVELKKGDPFTLTTEEITGNGTAVSISYMDITKDLHTGDTVLIDDGLINLKVTGIREKEVFCEVVNGGLLKDNKGVNIPEVRTRLPFISDKDRADLLFAVENDFDFIASSFVMDADCVNEVRRFLSEHGGWNIKIIAKIENREGVNKIDEILRVSDGILIARGDMGVEIPFEELPSIQKKIIRRCNSAGKPVITATQMLDSMIRNPRPTRAETTDVANAVYDGTNAIMLSGETSIGEFPIAAVRAMVKIAVEAENNIDYVENFLHTHINVSRNISNAISHSTCLTALSLGGAAIIAVTKSGRTAEMISKYRPECPVIATTFSRKVYNQLSLIWGVYPLLIEEMSSSDVIMDKSVKIAADAGLIKNGDLVVITGGMIPGVSGTTNTLKVHIIGEILAQGRGADKLTASGILYVVHEGVDPLKDFSAGEILVISRTTDEIISILKNAAAVITEEDMEGSQAVIAARALKIPVLANVAGATDMLKSGTVVTVDSIDGFIYAGIRK